MHAQMHSQTFDNPVSNVNINFMSKEDICVQIMKVKKSNQNCNSDNSWSIRILNIL